MDQSELEFHAGLRQHPFLAPEQVDKGCQVAIVHRLHDLFLDESLPGSARIGVGDVGLVGDEVLHECGASRPRIDPLSHLAVERDGPIQQQRRGGLVLEVARIPQRFIHYGKIVGLSLERCANAIDVAERGKELQRSGEKASAVEEIDQSLCAGRDDAIAHRWCDDCTGIEQKLRTCQTSEVVLGYRVAAVAVGRGSHPEQSTVVFIRPPGE